MNGKDGIFSVQVVTCSILIYPEVPGVTALSCEDLFIRRRWLASTNLLPLGNLRYLMKRGPLRISVSEKMPIRSSEKRKVAAHVGLRGTLLSSTLFVRGKTQNSILSHSLEIRSLMPVQ